MESKPVVVVEDDPAILLDAVSLFEDAGYPVLAFDNADDALACLYDSAGGVSAIFTDLQMPGHMDGLVLAEIVARHWPHVTVALTSGRVRPVGPLPGNVRFVPKPWNAADVLGELEAARAEAAKPAGRFAFSTP